MTDEHEHAMKVAEQAYSAGNLVTCDGYYEFDLDAAAAVIAADRAGLVARIAALEGALADMLHAAGFVAAVRADSGLAYPWEPLDIAEASATKKARSALKDTRHD